MRITSVFSLLNFVPLCYDCDQYDKINYRYSSYFLLALGMIFFSREYVASPIECWQKPEWDSSWLKYAQDYCLVEGTYFIPLDQRFPRLDET